MGDVGRAAQQLSRNSLSLGLLLELCHVHPMPYLVSVVSHLWGACGCSSCTALPCRQQQQPAGSAVM